MITLQKEYLCEQAYNAQTRLMYNSPGVNSLPNLCFVDVPAYPIYNLIFASCRQPRYGRFEDLG
jgi:hypothetical protein